MLPKNTELGTLEYIEVYDYYDFPQFFSCKNESGDIFLGLAIEDNPLTFLFSQIDSQTLNKENLTEQLPVRILQWWNLCAYKVEMLLSTKDTATLLTKEQTDKLLEELL